MFYRPSKHELKAQLEQRLRTALDFATLGAYEPEPAAHHDAPRGPKTRVFLFAKVSPPCPHSAVQAAACDAAGADAAEHQHVVTGGSLVGTRRRSRRSRRGGAVKLAPQPCTWAADPRD
jgi:hypothetical protein